MLIVILKSIWFVTVATGFAPLFAVAIGIILLTDKLGLTHIHQE